MKKAFSLIEVIFVLVILGIVASLSSQIIVQVYDNYLTQRALYNTTTKTEMVANQIVNRLTFAIDGTTITKKVNSTGVPTGTVERTDWIMLKDIGAAGNTFTTVEWIGYDNDSFAAGATPYWSGVADYTTATRNSFVSPGSNFSNVRDIMYNLSNHQVDLNVTNKPAAIIFSQQSNEYRNGMKYSPLCMGLIDETNTSCIFPVRLVAPTNNRLTFTRDSDPNNGATLSKIVSERYKMAWSAYAIVPELNSEGLHDLYLYYNYQPWNGETYTDTTTKKSLLMKNISVFKFTENGGVIQFKLCGTENIGKDYNISSCKEKAIIK